MVGLSGQAHADWAQSPKPLVIKPAPSDLREQPQNPPLFTWAKHSTSPSTYFVEVRQGTNVIKYYTTSRTWYLPTVALAPGTYTWRVRPSNLADWSSDRSFIISNNSVKFEVPEDSFFIPRLSAMPHPRSLQGGLPMYANWPAAMRAERGQYMTWLINETLGKITSLAPVNDAMWPLRVGSLLTAESVAQNADIRSKVQWAARQLESSVLLFRLTGEARYKTEALRRGDELAALDPAGGTSYVNQDQATRAITMSLAKAVDQMAGDLDATRKAAWLNVIAVRGDEMYNYLTRNGEYLDQNPLDAHAVNTVGFLALTSVLTLGDLPQAQRWFQFAFRYHIASTSPWSGPEGGFANGTAYGEYTIDYYVQIWQGLSRATGVNMFTKPWTVGFLNYFMEFMPPGSKTHVFGDAHESKPEMKFMKALALRMATPQAAWYARSLTGNEDPLSYLQGPYPMPANTVATAVPPPNNALFQSIGWAASHSDISSPTRTSVFFKSSPYGSFNHSHGDQNSFVLKKGGTALLAESGWYDWYGSPNWNNYYRHTRAHNAITVDGGLGQEVAGYEVPYIRNGKIVSYGVSPGIEYMAGDATAAYGGLLTKASRKLWYLRKSDVIVVHDQMASATPRAFEWNMHTLAPITIGSNNAVSVTKDGYSVCVRPILNTGIKFEKRTGGLVLAGNVEDHGVYVNTTKATSGEFLTVLDVGCKNTPVRLTDSASGRTLTVGTDSLVIPR